MKTTLQIALVAALIAVVAFFVRTPEELATDLMMQVRGKLPPDPRIVVCAVDTDSVHQIGQWPWRRTRVAALIDRLKADGAEVIALDIVFADPSRHEAGYDLSADDPVLAAAIKKAGKVVLGYFFRKEPIAVNAQTLEKEAYNEVQG